VKSGAPVVQQLAANVAASAAAAKTDSATAQALAAQLDQAAAALRALPESAQKTDALGAVSTARDASAGLAGALSAESDKIAGEAGVANAFSGQVQTLSKGLAQLHAGSTALTSGIAKLESGNASLATGIGKLATGGGQLTNGVTALRNGASQLENGLRQLTTGAGQLATGLSSGVGPSGRLASGLGTAQSSVTKFRSSLPSAKDLERLQRQSPGLFDSGYFVLAAIAGAPASQRTQASFAVNLDRGGRAGQITVVSRYPADDERTVALGDDLVTRTDRFAKATGTQAAVGGPAGALGDFGSAASDDLWLVVAGVALAVALFLMIMLRAVAMPAAAVAFDLLGVAATIGIMALLFCGDDPPLGGPGYIDPMSIIATFTATFGLTIVSEVQLLVAARDRFAATGDPHAALRFGLDRTAAATTGAALAMIAAIVPFAAGDLVVARQLGVAALIVIVLDALVIRPVLLPAAIAVLGPSGWWPTHGRTTGRRRPSVPTLITDRRHTEHSR
jgi:RND superfamily putative drug exporter